MIKKVLGKIIFSIIILNSCFSVLGQITVSNKEFCSVSKVRLSDKDYEYLKKSTVYFVKNYLIVDQDAFLELLQKNWKYSKIKLIEEGDMVNYINKENSIFFTMNYSLLDGRFLGLYYELWKLKDITKEYKSYNKLVYATFNLDIEYALYLKISKASGKKLEALLNSELKINNFKPGIIANYLKIINKSLSDKVQICDNEKDKESLIKLSDDTLFITNNFLQQRNYSNGENSKTELDEKEVMENYPYPYKFISVAELDSKLLLNQDFYYFHLLETAGSFTIFSSKGSCAFMTMYFGNRQAKYMQALAKIIEKLL